MSSGAGTAAGTSTVLGISPGDATHDASFAPGMGIYSHDFEEMVGRTLDASVVSGMGVFSGELEGGVPTHEKTYQFATNRALYTGGTSLELHQDAMLYMKDTMTGWASSPWTVTQSCKYTNGGGGGGTLISDFVWGPGDLWTLPGHLFWGNPYFSWTVLQAPVGSMQILIVLNYTPATCIMHLSPEGLFTTGTGPGVAGWPTAVDEIRVYGYGFGAQPTHSWLHDRNSVYPGQIHMLHSTDGELSMFICCANGIVSGHWVFWKSQNPQTGWGAPYSFFTTDCSDTNEGLSYDTGLSYPQTLYAWAISKANYTGDAGSPFYHGLTMEGFRPGTGNTLPVGKLWSGANAISGAYPMSPVHCCSTSWLDAAGGPDIWGERGYLGRIPDLYCTATGLTTGDTIEADPGTPTQEWAVMGDAVVPWDGSTPVTS